MNTVIKYLLFIGMLVSASVMPRLAHADISCSSADYVYVPAPNGGVITVDNSKNVGDIVGTAQTTVPSSGWNMSCRDPRIIAGGGGTGYGYFGGSYQGTNTYNGSYVYATGIQGLGYKLYFTGGGGNCGLDTYWPKACSYNGSTTGGTGFGGGTLIITFIKTGDIKSGTLSGTFGSETAIGQSGYATTTVRYFLWGSPTVITPAVKPTCSVDNNSVNVPMGRVTVPRLSIGQTFNPVDFTVQLNCSGGDSRTAVYAYMTLSDPVVSGNRSTTLNLGAGSTASGIGIQILHNGTPVSFGPAGGTTVGTQNQFSVGSSVGGNIVVPFVGRYVVTANPITGGLVAAAATFTVVYQ